jgi:4-guanidinobutyraldehyde dehydrogenase / NAD-dependent aldehyde dehydrogenase
VNPDWVWWANKLDPRVGNFVDGKSKRPVAAAEVSKFAPRDGRALYTVPITDARGVNDAVFAARRAFEDGGWSRLPVERRKEALFRLAELIEASAREFALMESVDVGKPISDALKGDIPGSVKLLNFCAEAADKLHSRVYDSDRTSLSYQLRRPLGVVGAIIGWNFPLLLAITKIGPALAAGNSVVLKPSELTALSAVRLAHLALEAGIPPGVFNVLHGDSTTGAALGSHPSVDLLSFTGSTATGKRLMVSAGQSNMKRLILECGGKAPFIVFDDCPSIDACVDALLRSAFYNQGAVCVAASRLLIQKGIRAGFIAALVARIDEVRPGDPLDEKTQFGALVSAEHLRKVSDFIAGAQSVGCRPVYLGPRVQPVAGGFYLSPAVFDDVPPEARIAIEEVFGPVLSIIAFGTEEEAIRLANGTAYGLSATLWTQDPGRAHRMAQQIQAGWMVVNTGTSPSGGPADYVYTVGGHGQSGIGYEGGLEGLESYTITTTVQWFN